MQLKSIKLAGFKSFVDPTAVKFPSNLCAVVGPNGCGKSNIIDAVRWVMGESSAKHLRGESMADVIFNGSGGRKPVGQASIELIFDNTKGTLGGEYAAYAELSIRRKITRDGQSNYYLNGNKCRRRDITDIFLGTGLGPRSYAIIEQGMISSLVESKPDELRVYIEEAAGISKYKERRRDTESRIRRTQENLERLTDIREEIGRQLQRLERQAQAAEKYADYKREERRCRAELLALRWRELDEQVAVQRQEIAQQSLRIEALVTERSAADTEIEKQRGQYTELRDRFNEVQGRYYAVGAEVARIEQSIQHTQDRARELRDELQQIERNCTESDQHLHNDRHKTVGWDAELQELQPQLEAARQAEQVAIADLNAAEEAMQGWQARWDEFNAAAAAPRQQAEVQQARIKHLEDNLQRLTGRISQIIAEREQLAGTDTQGAITTLSDDLAAAELEQARLQQDLVTVVDAVDSSRKQGVAVAAQLNEARTRLQTLLGREASLRALQEAALQGGGEEAQWLAAQGLQRQARLVDGIKVAVGWEVAVETVLGNYLQGVCVENLDRYFDQLSEFTGGELLLVAQAGSVQVAGGNAATLLSTRVEGLGQAFLNGVYGVETLAEALVLLPQLHSGESVVTRDGVWFGQHWLRVVRDKDAAAGVLLRKREIEELELQLGAVRQDVEHLGDQQTQVEQNLLRQEQQRELGTVALNECQRNHAELRSQLGAAQVQVEQSRVRRQRLEQDLRDAEQQASVEQLQLGEARQLVEQAIEAMARDNQSREELLQARNVCRATLDETRQRARHHRDRVHELAIREKSLSTQLASIREGIARLEIQVSRLAERRTLLLASVQEGESPITELRHTLAQQLTQRLSVEQELGTVRQSVEDLEHRMRTVEQKRVALEQSIQEQRALLEKLRITAQEITTRCATIVEQIGEQDYELEVLLTELPEQAEHQQWEIQLQQIGARIQRLGAINLAAIDEFKVESERKNYLDAQNAELVDALTTLENAIRKIDRETRTRFKETFDRVNNSLQELFPKLFGGGHAYLDLTGDDLLDTGVTLMAQPPGKKNTTIHLLSGGEKALTAIALVFAIFKLNPAPFCMLDEVDAPLDDANVGRYAKLVKEMSESVQFIYITHNKIAMEMAQHLMGVTMHEPGVSRMVSVDVDQAVELAQA